METVSPENIEKWRKAGKIAQEALRHGESLLKKGAVIREVCDAVDQKVIELGAKPAWPAQVGINEVAAHFTPEPDDNTKCEDHLISLDVGAHIDGCIGDNALTVDLSGKYSDLVKASMDAFKAGLKQVAVGAKIDNISKAIQEVIESAGFKPVKNLSGHSLSPFVIHDSPTIPNVETGTEETLVKGQVIALEPFSTTGAGMITESGTASIFSIQNKRPVRSQYAREVLKYAEENYLNLPFATRWLAKKFGIGKAKLAIRELDKAGILHSYPPLVEKDKGAVAVHENTILVADKTEVLTKK